MADNWDDGSDDEWDVSDEALDARLGLTKKGAQDLPTFDDEEDLAIKEKEQADKAAAVVNRKKGEALAAKKAAEAARKEEEELARRAVELEAAAEANLSPEELKSLKQRQIEKADHELTNDLFGAVEQQQKTNAAVAQQAATDDVLVLKDMKDNLKHARKVAGALRQHGNIHFATAFFKESLQQSSPVLNEDAVADLIKTLNVMKNEKVQAAKRKVKGQAQKSKKQDKVAVEKARKLVETFGDNDNYDEYDQMGGEYEDAFF